MRDVKRIALVGAGHAHIVALRRFAKSSPDAEITLINNGQYAWYTGALPALIRGNISADQARLNVRELAKSCGAKFINANYKGHCERSEAIHLSFTNHDSISCDRLSLSLGGTVIPGGVKPIPVLLDRIKTLECLAAPKIAIIGAGAGGVELALALRVRLGKRANIYLQPSESGILPDAPGRVRLSIVSVLSAADIMITKTPPEAVDDTIRAYTPKPSLAIRPTLQLTASENIFATGDCARFSPPLPRSGAIAVRQGRVLAHNLSHENLKSFTPPNATLAIISLNQFHALAWYGIFYCHGRLPMRLKTWLDQRWLAQ
jgi:selenide,water dikinase